MGEGLSYREALDTPTQSVLALLRQCGDELKQSLNHSTGTIRHAFFAVGGLSKPAVTTSLIDLTLGEWLGADKYDSLVLGPVQYPLPSDKQAELWHVFLLNGTVNRASIDQWCSTATNLDVLACDPAFSDTFSGLPQAKCWLLQLYRLAMRHPEWGLGELRGASLPKIGGILPAPVLSESGFFESWLIGQSVLPDGDHFMMLFDDIRTCSLRTVWRAESPIKSQLDADERTIGKRVETDGGQIAELASDLTSKAKPSTERGDKEAAFRLLSVFTNGLADERLDKATNVLNDDNLTVNEKLSKIDALMQSSTKAPSRNGRVSISDIKAAARGRWNDLL